jgi:hypothetical protein
MVICKLCDEAFSVVKKAAHGARYCPSCRRKVSRAQAAAYRKAHPQYERDRAEQMRAQRALVPILKLRKDAALKRARYLAERDRAAERAASGAGIPLPKVEYRNGRRIERRGTCPICGGFPTSKI